MRTAHQNVPLPQLSKEAASKQFVDTSLASIVASYDVLFQWNHTDISEFTLTEPLADGWSVGFVSATTTKAEHILVTSANTGSASRAYLMANSTVGSPDYEMWAIHNFFNTSNQQYVYAVSRGDDIATNRYAAARWEQPAGELTAVYNEGGGDVVAAGSLEMVPGGSTSPQSFLVETHSSVRGPLIGKGWGRVSNYGQIDASTFSGLGTSENVGLRFSLPTAASAFTIEIYDFVVFMRRQ